MVVIGSSHVVGLGHDGGYGGGYGRGHGNGRGSGLGFGRDGYGYGEVDKEEGAMIGDNKVTLVIDGYGYRMIDGIFTHIKQVHGNCAKVLVADEQSFKVSDAYLVSDDEGLYAHGETLREAQQALVEKKLARMNINERLQEYRKEIADPFVKVSNKELFNWHGILTGSCEYGRKQFVKSHNIDLDSEMTTVEFVKLCEDAYGGNVIRRLVDE